MVLFCCLLEYRSNNDIYSVLDIPGYADKPVTTKSNMVVDTIRIISGIPQSQECRISWTKQNERNRVKIKNH